MPLQVTVCAVTLCLSAMTTIRACADETADKTPHPTNQPSKDATKTSSNTGTDKATGVTLTVEESAAKKQEDKNKTPDRHLSRGDQLARSALSYRGAPYRFGGRSSQTGFDCSGLVQAVCAKWGIYLPRAANAQYSMGKPVSKENLQPGDLVFFANTYKSGISHVGIYIGNGEFIHACGSGKGVIVTRLDEDYHKKHYAGARRLDLSKLPPVPGEEDMPKHIIMDDGASEEKGDPPPGK
ncbi:MAG TPA: C40 family peptidase [Chthonomonadaceae bacterium]|nr:C40 family peptidase [Chthonomonadaceae bacterium]